MKDRKNSAGPWSAVSLLCLVVGGVAAAGAQQAPAPQLAPLEAGDLPAIVARVDGDEISRLELIAQAETMRFEAMRGGVDDPAKSEQFLPMVLDALINERLVLADSKSRGVGPTESEIGQQMEAVTQSYGGEEALDKALAAQGLDRQYVRQKVMQSLSFDHLMNREIKPGIEVGEDAIRTYYETNKEQMRLPVLYKVRRIIKQFPQEGGDEVRQSIRSQLETVRQQAVGGADFAALAKEHSDDDDTREKGGELPWFALPGKGDALERVIAGLEVGQLSEVLQAPGGLLLIRLEERQPERTRTLEEVRGEITNILAASEARRVIQGRVERLRSDANVEILM